MCLLAKNLHWTIYIMLLYGEVISANTLTLNSVFKDLCSRPLSNLIYNICSGDIKISDVPQTSLSRVRSRRASLFYASKRVRRQIADECCLHPCTVAQLLQYCPEEW